MARNSIFDLFVEHAEKNGGKTAALSKVSGTYRPFTWKQLYDDARRVSAGLVGLGVQPGDRVILISQTRLEWLVCDMGILGAGAVTVPIYPSNLADDCQYITENSGAVVVLAEDATQVQKFRAERARLPNVKKVIQLTGAVSGGDDWVVGYEDWKTKAPTDEAALEARRQSLTRDSLLTIIYTSGTTGRPKGVVLTHAAMLYEAEAILQIDLVRPDELQFLFLPLAHVLGKVLIIAWLASGHTFAIAENLNTIKENLGETKPTMMAAVPRIYEKFHATVVQKGLSAGGTKAKLFRAALELSEKNIEAEMQRKSLGAADTLKFAVLKKLIFKKVGAGLSEVLGGRMRLMVSGGAPLSPKIAAFFRDAGVTVLEGYGLTETSAATTVNRPNNNRLGTVGLAMPGMHLRIAEDGEILIKGPAVMREYWKNPDATRESIDKDGWFHSGDIGIIDGGGFLKITDRKKDIIVTAGGKNVAPQNIENLLKTHPLISQAVIHGDKRKFLSALITIDPDALKRMAGEQSLGNGSYAELTQKPEVQKAVEAALGDFNRQLASFESIKKFKILEHDFTVESGELTPSLKVKRKVINERYKNIFDGFYEER